MLNILVPSLQVCKEGAFFMHKKVYKILENWKISYYKFKFKKKYKKENQNEDNIKRWIIKRV